MAWRRESELPACKRSVNVKAFPACSMSRLSNATSLTVYNLPAANRISTLHDFGFVALDMKYTQEEDSGTYTCRATNDLGQAATSATAVIQCKENEPGRKAAGLSGKRRGVAKLRKAIPYIVAIQRKKDLGLSSWPLGY